MARQLTTGGQARRRQGLTPRGPGRQAVAGRGQLPQTPCSQAKQPSSTDLLQRHDPVSISSGHQRRVSVRIACEQALTISTAGALSVRALTTDADATAIAVVVGVLGGHQQAGQQPLDHTGQRSTAGQGPQQTHHVLSAGHSPRRRVPGGRAQRPGRTTGRDTRKHTAFEHMYSIARISATRTAKQHSESPAQQRKPGALPLMIGGTRRWGGAVLVPAHRIRTCASNPLPPPVPASRSRLPEWTVPN